MFVEESGVAKTDALKFLRDALRAAGLGHLLLPSTFTAALAGRLALAPTERDR